MIQRLRPLVDAPITAPALVVTLIILVWAGSEGGYPPTHWYPGALFVVALLLATALVLPLRLAAVPRPVLAAVGFLLAFTLWSYLSIAWADAPGEAWDGANRTLLYLLVFALFALWPQRGETAALVLGTWTLAIIGIELVELLRISGVADPSAFFYAGRLAAPPAYPNAAAAIPMMAFWPAVVLAARVEVPWWLRGAFAGGAVVLADVALLAQSRGSIYSIPLLVIAFFVFVPGRLRSIPVLLLVALPVAATVPRLLDVRDELTAGKPAAVAVSGVVTPVLLAAIAVAGIVTLAAWFEVHRHHSPERVAALRRASVAVGAGAAVALVAAGFVAAKGNPVARASDAWDSFKRGKQVTHATKGSRLSAGLGSNRYDAYRVALNSFESHPLQGVGADNFAEDYLEHGRSDEMLRYPHSLEMRTLSQTGLVGAALLLGAVVAAFMAILRAVRRPEPLAAAVAGAAGMVFAYWLVHGSFDWFWEFAGLGSAAFAMAGLACSLAPRPTVQAGSATAIARGPGAWAAGAVAALAAVSLLAPWLAERDVQRAARTWSADPARAFQRLDQAADLNPLSSRPYLIAGSIALRLGDLDRARSDFAKALERDRRDVYATLELGVIASQQGNPAAAGRRLERAAALAPRDAIVREALERVGAGGRLDTATVNRQILIRAANLAR